MVAFKPLVLSVKDSIVDNNTSLISAGVAFYAFLSIFPALASILSIYGLVADPKDVERYMEMFSGVMPSGTAGMLSSSAKDIAAEHRSSLSLGLVLGLIVSLWSANRAMKAVATALNIAYDTKETRGIIKLNLITLTLTFVSTVVAVVALSAIVLAPIVISVFLSRTSAEVLVVAISWICFIVLLLVLFLVVYRYAPSHHSRPWRDLLPGAGVAAVLFIIGSIGFSTYVANFGKYDEQYGALATVVVTMLWLFIGTFIFLLGAEINANIERQKQ